MADKEVDYGRMLTGLSHGILAINKHEHALKALRAKFVGIIEEIDILLKDEQLKEPQLWYDAISKEHDDAIRADYEKRADAAHSPREEK